MPAQVPQELNASRRPLQIVVGGIIGLGALLAIGTLVALWAFHAIESRPIPAFESLADHPDATLGGTVAYTAGTRYSGRPADQGDRCVRVVAAAGQPAKDVYCLEQTQPGPDADTLGKEMSAPQLVWRDDGRLEITMFRMRVGPDAGKQPVYTAAWQKVVDVRTGAVEDVPAELLPSGPNLTTRPTVNSSGQQLAWTSNGQTGRVKVTVTDTSGTRTLLSAHGPGEYGYSLFSAFWAPDGKWIAADDGRLLVITDGTPPITRILVDGAGGFADFPTFAVTSANLLTDTPAPGTASP